MLETVRAAVGFSKAAVERQLSEAQEASLRRDYFGLKWAAQYLANDAAALALATDTLHVLEESKTREEFVIVREQPKQQAA